jgi:nucleoside-specific outer membrane channel protein Tsx
MKYLTSLMSFAAIAAALPGVARSADFSDTSLGYRYAYHESEPGVVGKINKNIFNLTHVSGDATGVNFFTVDLLMSHGPDFASGGTDGAQEIYGFYQRSFSLSKLTHRSGGFGFFKDIDMVGRFDFGTKNTTFGSRPRKLRVGIDAALPVPAGFWNIGLQAYKETNHNGFAGRDITFDTTAAATTVWSIPAFGVGSFGGFVDVIGPKGKDAFGVRTGTEVLARTTFMFDVFGPKSPWKVGAGVEYWKNKFGNRPANVSFAPDSTKATSVLFLVEYHL